jgi:transposase
MEENWLYLARKQVVEAMEQELPRHEAAKRAGLQISQSTAYRLRQRLRQSGEQSLQEGRHGHPATLRGEIRTFLEERCQQAPSIPSHEMQNQLAARFTLPISVSQINRVRATLGVSKTPPSAKKTEPTYGKARVAGRGGGILLLAAVHETALLSQLEEVLPMKQPISHASQPARRHLFRPQQSLLLTLLFLPAVGLHRFWNVRSDTGRELTLLTGPLSLTHF